MSMYLLFSNNNICFILLGYSNIIFDDRIKLLEE